MAKKQTYECTNCGKTIQQDVNDTNALECCGKPMRPVEPLDTCQVSTTAEHSRFDDISEPCDDGRAG